MKIELSLFKPVAHGRFINSSCRKLWVPFQYEKLPKIYFRCGGIVHDVDGCSNRGLGLEKDDNTAIQFGTWLCAEGDVHCKLTPLSSINSFTKKDDNKEEVGRWEALSMVASLWVWRRSN